MIKFITTQTGKNIIEMGEYGKLIFSDLTATPIGYKFLTYNRSYVEQVELKQKNGSREYREVDLRESYVFNLKLKRDSKGKQGVPRKTIPIKLTKWLQKNIGDLTDGDVFPFENIKRLKLKISKTNFERLLTTTRSTKKKKTKKITKKEKAAQEKSLAILRGSLNDKGDS